MIRLYPRRTTDVAYYLNDPGLELDGVRRGGPGRFLLGEGDPTSEVSVRSVLQGTPRGAIQGYDLVVAAPRALSILLAVGTEREQRVLVEAHQHSVADAFSYLQDRGLCVVSRRGGDPAEFPATIDRAVSFTHGINRAGEPHLHDHLIIPARDEGTGLALASRSLYVHLEAADALYRAQLRHSVSQLPDRVAWRSFRGGEFVSGISEGHRALWPGRNGRGLEKRYDDAKTIRATWERDLQRLDPIAQLDPPRRSRTLLDEHTFGAVVDVHAAPRRRDVVRAVAHAAIFGATARDLTRLVDYCYPELRGERGLYEATLSKERARLSELVRAHGPRPLDVEALVAWRHRERVREGPSRSR